MLRSHKTYIKWLINNFPPYSFPDKLRYPDGVRIYVLTRKSKNAVSSERCSAEPAIGELYPSSCHHRRDHRCRRHPPEAEAPVPGDCSFSTLHSRS